MIKYASILLLIFLSSCGVVSFKKMALYDHYEQPLAEKKVEQIIYDDGIGTMWNSMFECGKFEITKESAYSGNASIKISWDKNKGCEWIGFGNSFSNWTATDMSQERLKKALSFYVRTQTKTSKALPIVAAMEDFGGGGSYYLVDTRKYLYGLEIDTTWKRVIVPLWDFPIREDEVDIYSIKQMQFQLEGAGSFYLDEIKLIDYTKEEYEKMRADVEAMKPKGSINQIVYREGNLTNDAWATGEKMCHTLEEKVDENANKFIHWKFNAENCSWAKWGINWNDWYQINFRGIENDSKLQFRVKTTEGTRFKILLEDFSGRNTEIFSMSSDTAEWQTIEIPFAEFNLKTKGFQLDQIKQLLFEGITSGEIFLDDIKIIKK